MKLFTHFGRLTTGFLFALAMVSFTLEANTVKLNSTTNDIRITENTGQGFTVTFSFSEFKTMDVKTPKGVFTRFIVPSYSRHGDFGYPELPVKSELIEIPVNAQVKFNSISYSVKEYSLKDLGINYPIMPNQPPVAKTGEPVEFIYNKSAYRVNDFNPVTITSVEPLGTMRGVNIGRLDIVPIEYNPVTGMIRVYENLVFEITFENADLQTTELNKQIYSNHYFSPVFNSLLNYREPENAGRENFSRYPIKFVIVSDPMFEEQLQPFIEWKIKKGFTVIEAYTNDPNVGTTTFQIKAYLQGLYESGTTEDPAPTFVLFVGDIAQVPTWTGQAAGHVTDLYYCEYTGDYFPEVFYGRFSAQNTTQLQPQIDKTLMYEQYTMPIPTYLDTVVMIAGMDGNFGPVHANGQILYGTENYFNASNGIYSHTYLYPASGSNAALIRQNISDGVTFANYTAHGSPDGWADPTFSISQIAALQNDGKYGLLVGNCCSTSEYQVGECFGEAIVRAANKGAVGYIGASNSSYWDEDYYWGVGVGPISGDPPSYEETSLGAYDRMFHTHGELFGEWYTTMDQMVFAGNLAVTEGGTSLVEYYWEAYNLMGDPSLMIYFSEPPAMTVTFNPLLPLGSETFTVNAAPYAYVAVSMDGVGLGAALADSLGLAVVNLATVPGPGNADVVVTAQNYQPYSSTVLIANPEGPYITVSTVEISDAAGNANGLLDYGETVFLTIGLTNLGTADAIDVSADISTEDSFISISSASAPYGTIPAGVTVTITNGFEITALENIPDLHMAIFGLDATGTAGRETWSSSFTIQGHAPVLEMAEYLIDDAAGNNNGRLDPGETATIQISALNAGSADAYNVTGNLSTQSLYVTVNNSLLAYGNLTAGITAQQSFEVTIDPSAPAGHAPLFMFDLAADMNITGHAEFVEYVGQIPVLLLDWDENHNSAPVIEQCLNNLEVGYDKMDILPEDRNLYTSIFVCLGTYSDNHVLTAGEGEDLAEYLEQGGNLYMEGGDTWYYDEPTAVHPMFNITGTEDGASDLVQLTGQPGTFAEDMSFLYDGDNNWIDHLAAIPPAQMLFMNSSPAYGAAVLYDAGTYRTIGSSFEFGGLQDGDLNKDDLMIRLLEFFNIQGVWTDVKENDPLSSVRSGSYPNPFRDETVIRFEIQKESRVSVGVYNISGQLVNRLLDTEVGAGTHEVRWDGSGSIGNRVAEGMYFYRLQAGSEQVTGKLILMK